MKRQVLGNWTHVMKIVRANKKMNHHWNDLYGYRYIDVEHINFKDEREYNQWKQSNPTIILYDLNLTKLSMSELGDMYLITLTL